MNLPNVKTLTVLMTLFMLAAEVAMAVPQYPTGALPPSAAEKAWAAKNVLKIEGPAKLASPLPASVKNTQYLPAVGLQAFGSCAAWAVTYYHKTYQEAKEHGWTRPNPATAPSRVMSPAFTYNLNNGGLDLGSSMAGNYQILLDHGAASCYLMGANADFTQWPTEAVWRAAIPYRAKSLAQISANTAAGLLAVKQHLASGDVGTFSMMLHNNFVAYPAEGPGVHDQVLSANANGVYTPPRNLSANHALTLIGYDDAKAYHLDDGTTRQGAFLAVNSWGTGWGCVEPTVGTAGFIWLGYDYFMANVSSPVYTMVDRTAYQPRAFAVFEIEHGRMLELSVHLTAGDRDAPAMDFDVLPRAGGDRWMNVRVVADATDFHNAGYLSYWLNVSDQHVPSLFPGVRTGTLKYFAIELPGLQSWVCPDVPADTVNFDPSQPLTTDNGHLYRNISFFRPRGAVFEGREFSESSHAWGDIDNDGRPEMIVCGFEGGKFATRAFHGDGAGNFSDMDAGLPGLRGHLALGDYNNDGNLDVALSGDDGASIITKIYRNLGGGRFVVSKAMLPAMVSRLAWIDDDGDGDLDLSFFDSAAGAVRVWRNKGGDNFANSGIALAGGRQFAWADADCDGRPDLATATTEKQTIIYRNTGGGKFTPASVLTGFDRAPLLWGDYDNDGRLDLLVHQHYGMTMHSMGRLYHNNGGFSFSDAGVDLPSLNYGAACWGDVNNDGRMDLALCGDQLLQDSAHKLNVTRIYLNRGGGKFTDLCLDLPSVSDYTIPAADGVQLVDFDGDGDLDLSVCGAGRQPFPLPRTARLYENRAAQADGFARPNLPPSAPATLTWSQAGPTSTVYLKWTAGKDAETTRSGGLYYNVRVGKNPGWNNSVSGAIGSPFLGGLVRPMISVTQPGLALYPPPSGPFYLSVQTIDSGLRPSAWSTPMLVQSSGLKPGDANRDGKVNVVDVVKTQLMATGKAAVDVAAADRNGDGVVDAVDVLHTRAILIDAAGPAQDLSATGRIGSAGGTLAGGGATLTVPAGAFATTAEIRIYTTSGDRPFGNDTASEPVRVEGIPSDIRQPLKVRLTVRFGATAGTKVFGAIGDLNFVKSVGQARWTHQLLPATKISTGVYEFTIPAPDGAGAGKPLAAAGDTAANYSHTWQWALVGGSYGEYSGGSSAHFRIRYPASVVASGTKPVEDLAAYLEAAYNTIKNTWGFSYATRTKWPVDVCIKDLAAGTYGYFVSSKLGDNYGWMEFNANELAQSGEMKVTAGHEFFHLVQGLYDTRNRFSKATGPGRQYWLDEAVSTWSEIPFSGSTSYVSTVFAGNEFDPLDGMHQEGAAMAGPHGYGMSTLIKYIVGRRGTGVLVKIYNDLKAGYHPVSAISRNGSADSLDTWYVNYLGDYYRGAIYPLSDALLGAMTPGARRFTIQSDADLRHLRKFSAQVGDLGGTPFAAVPTLATIPADASFYARVEGADLSASMLKISATQRQHLAFGTVTNPDVLKFEIPNLKSFQTGSARLLLSVVNNRAKAPYTGKQKAAVELGVVSDQTYAYKPVDLTAASTEGYQFPAFRSSATNTLKGRGLMDIIDSQTGGMQWCEASVIGLAQRKIELTYTAAPRETSLRVDGLDGYTVYSVAGIKTYELEVGNDTDPFHSVTKQSASGKFSVDITIPNFRWYTAYVYALYDLKIERFDSKGKLLSTRTEPDQRTTLLLQFFHL